MTGEMHAIDPVTGEEPDGTTWSYHAAAAQAVGGQVKPFDQYQGPYVVVGRDLRVGPSPYAVPVRNLGIVRLWLVGEGDYRRWYREDTDEESVIFFTEEEGAEAAYHLTFKEA